MASIIFYPQNILEDGTVTVTGTADTGFPESRLYDRSISLYWKDTVTEAKVFHVDYGAAVSCDALFVHRHNFSGEDMEFQHSENDADWTDAVTDWSQTDNLIIAKVMAASASKRYWQVKLTSMENPQCGEVYISLGYSFSLKRTPSPVRAEVDNIRWQTTMGGAERSTKFGEVRRTRTYSFQLTDAQLTTFQTAMDFLDGYLKPLFIKDHAGIYWFARFVEPPVFNLVETGISTVTVKLVEVL